MDEAIAQLTSLGTIVFGLGIYIGMLGLRKIIETAKPSLKQKAAEDAKEVTYGSVAARWYNKVVLYFLPLMLGGATGFFDIPFIFGENITTTAGKVFFGVVVGNFSSLIFKLFRGGVEKQTGIKVTA